MRFGVLGTLEVVDDDGAPVELGGPQSRAVLALLLVAAGRVVPAEAVVDALWGDDPPVSAAGTLQSYIHRLRRALEPHRAPRDQAKVLLWEPPGYRLDVDEDHVDFRRFERLAGEGRGLLDAGEPDEARRVLLDADALWRGVALLEYADHEFARGLATRLEERRIAALEDRFEADLRLGRHAAVVGELSELVAANPLREALRAHLALALYRSGRQAEALRCLDEGRRTLRDELGVDPGRPLRDLEAQILAQDAALDHVAVVPQRTDAATAAPVLTPPAAEPADAATRLVGRRPELAQLVAALDETAVATRFALVEGDPGIGKTRLVEELAAEAARRGGLVVWGRSHEGGAAPAFWPWLAALRALVEAVPDAADPGVAQLLAPAPDTEGAFSPGANRFLLLESIAAAVARGAAATPPLLVLLDDLQWADHASLELLGFLAGRLVDEPVLVVGTVRELDVGRNDAVIDALAAVSRRPGSRRLQLRGLEVADTARLLEQVTGRSVDEGVAGAIHDRAEGNPFYATELARLLVDGASLDEVPAGVRDVVRQRLARLPDATVELLQVGAVIGRDVDLALLARASRRSIDDCLDDLEAAVAQRLLAPAPDSPGSFRFSHALVREVVIDDVSSLRRARMHLRVADAIVDSGDTDDVSEILADHLWEAVPIGVGGRAADALERAAEVAVRRLAYEAGEDLLDRAVQLRRAAGSGPEQLEAELVAMARLFSIRRALHGYADLIDSPFLARAKDLAERAERTDILVQLLWGEWAGFDTACAMDRANPLAEQLYELAAASDDPATRLIGYHVWGIHCWHYGRMTEARDNLDASVRASGELPASGTPLLGFEQEQRLLGAAFAGFVHDLVGDLDDIEGYFARLSADQDDRYGQSIVQLFASAAAMTVGDIERTERESRKGVAADPDLSFSFWSGGCRAYLGAALALQGNVAEGLPIYELGRSRYAAAGVNVGLCLFSASMGLAMARAGRLDEARGLVEQAYRELEQFSEHWTEPAILAMDAEIRHLAGAPDEEVVALLRRSADLAATQGSHAAARRAVTTAQRLGLPFD